MPPTDREYEYTAVVRVRVRAPNDREAEAAAHLVMTSGRQPEVGGGHYSIDYEPRSIAARLEGSRR